MEVLQEELQRDLVELWGMQREIQSMGSIRSMRGEGFDDTLRKWLGKAREIAKKHNPQSFTVSVGFPLGGQLSFTWSSDTRKETVHFS